MWDEKKERIDGGFGPVPDFAQEAAPGQHAENGERTQPETTVLRVPPLHYIESGDDGKADGPARRARAPRSAVTRLTAVFLAGALSVGGLMYASDTMNWFGGAARSAATAASSSASEGIRTASYNLNVADLYKQASPAVVKIVTYAAQQQQPLYGRGLRSFFGGGGEQQPGTAGQLQELGLGTGFFFKSDGYLLTNAHVIAGADQIKVTVEGYDQPFTATVVGSDVDLDLAVLKVEPPSGKSFPALTLADSASQPIGEWVVAIGNPLGYDETLTVGVLSAKEREIQVQREDGGVTSYKHLLQTDTSINPGNSGGPLLNAAGQVIGINTAIDSSAEGIGFAIPSSVVSDTLAELLNGGQSGGSRGGTSDGASTVAQPF